MPAKFTPQAGLLIASVVLLAVLLAGLRAIFFSDPTCPDAPSAATPTASKTVPFPTSDPAFDITFPLTQTQVTPGHKVTINGVGNRQVSWTVADGSMVVAHLDCSLCDILSVNTGDRSEPVVTGGHWEGDILLTTVSRASLLKVSTVGRWILTLTASADLPSTSGTVRGIGAKVVVLAGPASGVRMEGEGVRLAAYRASDRTPASDLVVDARGTAPVASGRQVTLSFPAVVQVDAPGTWTLTPVP